MTKLIKSMWSKRCAAGTIQPFVTIIKRSCLIWLGWICQRVNVPHSTKLDLVSTTHVKPRHVHAYRGSPCYNFDLYSGVQAGMECWWLKDAGRCGNRCFRLEKSVQRNARYTCSTINMPCDYCESRYPISCIDRV